MKELSTSKTEELSVSQKMAELEEVEIITGKLASMKGKELEIIIVAGGVQVGIEDKELGEVLRSKAEIYYLNTEKRMAIAIRKSLNVYSNKKSTVAKGMKKSTKKVAPKPVGKSSEKKEK